MGGRRGFGDTVGAIWRAVLVNFFTVFCNRTGTLGSSGIRSLKFLTHSVRKNISHKLPFFVSHLSKACYEIGVAYLIGTNTIHSVLFI